jgi:UDP-GlcNAc:undecaprenyl-phosphate/decaprenyl-phosphate GlcNAc-1-phosphate transferase
VGGIALALLISAFVGAALIRLGPMLGFVDRPDGHLKPHEHPAVPLGGVGIFIAVHAGMALEGELDPGLLAASAILLAVGLVDDRYPLSRVLRLGLELGAGIVLVLAADLPAVAGSVGGAVMVVVLVVVAANAVNLLDGLDGLAGSSALVAALGVSLLAASRDLGIVFGLITAAALAGFLIWNWPRARMFLGDNGAYSVALFLVYGIVRASPHDSELAVLVASGLLGVFVVDLAVTLIRRRLSGVPLFEGDRSHVYDQLRDRGMPVAQVALTFAGAQAAIVGLVVIIDVLAPPIMAVALLAVTLMGVVFVLGRAGFLSRA